VDGRPKADSRTLLYSIDALHTAISAGRLVQFRYKNNSTWTVSPWQLAWEGGCYYLIAYQDEKDPANIRNYRVDRMSYVKVLDRPRRGKEAFAAFDLPSYLRKHFNMFGGPEYRVTLRCTADLEAAMRDRFGQDTLFLPEADGYFHFDVPVCVSDQFYGWVCGFGGKVEVTAPAEVRQGLHDMVQELAEQHTDPESTNPPAGRSLPGVRSLQIILSHSSNSRSLGKIRSSGALGSATRRRLWLKMAFSSVLRARRPLPAVRLSSA